MKGRRSKHKTGGHFLGVEFYLKILEWFSKLIWPPLRFDVLSFSWNEVRNSPHSSIFFVTAWPRRYFAELSITNRSDKTVYIKSVILKVGQEKEYREPLSQGPLRLEAHEIKSFNAKFPIGENEEPEKAGPFQIEITPSVGRKTIKRINFSKPD